MVPGTYLSYCRYRRYIPTSLAYQPDNNYQELGGDPYPVFPVLTGTFEPYDSQKSQSFELLVVRTKHNSDIQILPAPVLVWYFLLYTVTGTAMLPYVPFVTIGTWYRSNTYGTVQLWSLK